MMLKNRMKAFGLRWSKAKERGATAVVIGLTLLLVVGAAAISFDTANLALQRQTLRNIVDASAQAGAGYLPDFTTAKAKAKEYAAKYDSSLVLDVAGWCMVTSTGATKQVKSGQFPSTCDPSPSGSHVFVNGVGGVKCDEFLCAIPCTAADAQCNAVQVSGSKNVPYYFAPAIGIPNGNTGSVTSVSCTNLCNGGGTVNPMDVAIIADRTPSMSDEDFSDMKAGISQTLGTMTPEYQFVTFGAIHKSRPTATCKTTLGTAAKLPLPDGGARLGDWMPIGFYNDYLTGTLTSSSRTLNSSSTLVKSVSCMDHYSEDTAVFKNWGYPYGTHLAAPLKDAARMLLETKTATPSLSSMYAARAALLPVGATVTKAIIFETDGQPAETMGVNGNNLVETKNTSSGSTLLTNALEPTSKGNAEKGCENLKAVATEAKNAGIKVMMIAFGDAATATCGKYKVRDIMAAAASPLADGVTPSAANYSCAYESTAAQENSDGDNFFCAATGAQLAGLFTSALKAAQSGNTKFVKMPA